MTCHVHGAHVLPRVTTADDALRHALARWLPEAEQHEIDHIRAGLRERGHDVLALVREAQ